MNKTIMLLILSVLMFSCKNETKTENKKNDKKKIAVAQPVKEEEVVLTEIESNFLKKLIKEDIGGQEYENLQIKKSPFSVRYPNEDDAYTVSFSIVKKTDLNNDGIMDYIIDRTSDGMLGGNANSNQSYVFYIMKDEINVQEEHSVLGYAPFSYNIIDDAKFVENAFKVDITQNFRTYSVSAEDLKSTSLSFIYKNGNLYEESYLSDCKLSKLKSKTIFKSIPGVEKRTRSIEMHNYTETIEEIYKKNDTIITASAGGCDNLSLSFDTSYKVDISKLDDDEFKKNTSLQLLSFLSKNTQFSKEINIVTNYFKEKPITDDFIETVKGYGFRILIQKKDENKNELRFLIQIDKIDNPFQTENWEITTRNKKEIIGESEE